MTETRISQQTGSDRDEAVFVGLVWLAMTISLFWFVAYHGGPVPFVDDLGLAPELSGHVPLSWASLLHLHNEHLVPLTKLIVVPLTRATGDIRAGMFLQALALSATALASVLAARRLRGRAAFSDAFFPLLWLSMGNPENLMMAFQVAITLPAVIAMLFLLTASSQRGPPGPMRAVVLGLGLISLPFFSAAGVPLVPPLAAWMLFAALQARRRGDSPGLVTALSVSALLGLAGVAIYAALYEPAPSNTERPSLGMALVVANRFLGLAPGAIGAQLAPWTGLLVTLAGALTVFGLVRAFRRSEEERLRSAGMLAVLAGVIGLALSIGWGRGSNPYGGLAVRYVGLPAPLLCAGYLASCCYGRARGGQLAQFLLFFGSAVLVGSNTIAGLSFGEMRRKQNESVVAQLDAGWTANRIAETHPELGMRPQQAAAYLQLLMDSGLFPLPRTIRPEPLGPGGADLADVLGSAPESVHAPRGSEARTVHGLRVLAVLGEAEIRFALPSASSRLRAAYGMMPLSYRFATSDGLAFSVELQSEGEPSRVLFQRLLEPRGRGSDRGPQELALDLPADARGTLVLRTANPPGFSDTADWAFWSRITFE